MYNHTSFKPFRPYLIEKKIDKKHSIKNKMTWKIFLGAEFGRPYRYTGFKNPLDTSQTMKYFAKIFTIVANQSNLNVCESPGYVSA